MYKYAVIKFGGHALEQKDSLETLINNINYLKNNNYKTIIVHGGTPAVDEKLKQYNIKSDFINGYRVTTKEIMNMVEEAILGIEVIKIVKTLNRYRLNVMALSGFDCNLIKCKKAKFDETIDYGFVGEIVNINYTLINSLLDDDIIPIISPIGCDDHGNSYNLNSDYLASQIALSIRADYLFMITNVNGVYMDVNQPNSRIKILDRITTTKLIEENVILPTMATKVNACLDYVCKLNTCAYILDSHQKINYNLFSSLDYGTKIVNNTSNYEIRLAHKEDVEGILNVMKKAFVKYQKNIEYQIAPLKETYEDLLKDLDKKLVFALTIDNNLIGTIRLSHIDGTLGGLSRICVLDDYQNAGFGSKLIKFAENYAYQRGFNKLGLTTLDNVNYLENFYIKNGYSKVATDDKRGYTRSLMIKDLGNNISDINTNLFM